MESAVVALLANFLASALGAFFGLLQGHLKRRDRTSTFGPFDIVAGFFAFIIAVRFAVSTGLPLRFIKAIAEGSIGAQFAGTTILLACGGGLFVLRKWSQRTYALLELAIAAVTAYSSLKNLPQWQSVSSWVPIAGAIYLVVRGLTNLDEGNRKAREAKNLTPSAAVLMATPPSIVTAK
ncbi:hypothetical protein [Corallococcus sp. CA049B]|uniref:hypothetical protein n=1 Tax=Corallococcus sp. CA049B TaxID=2316730 RepID=UPI0011C4291A|nr:hypothetical protein [Corallococcus sp. CA049B]